MQPWKDHLGALRRDLLASDAARVPTRGSPHKRGAPGLAQTSARDRTESSALGAAPRPHGFLPGHRCGRVYVGPWLWRSGLARQVLANPGPA